MNKTYGETTWNDHIPMPYEETPEYKNLLKQLHEASEAYDKCGCKSCNSIVEGIMMDLAAIEDDYFGQEREKEMQEELIDNDPKTPIKDKFCPICSKQMYSFDDQLSGIKCEDFQCFSITYFYGKPELIVKGHLYDYEKEIEVYKKLNRCNAISQQNADEYIKSLAGLPTTNFIEPPDFDICSKCNVNKVEQDHFVKGSNGVGPILTKPICNACVDKYNNTMK